MARTHSFVNLPDVKRKRTKIRIPYGLKTTMSVGKLYPIDFMEVLPGDTISGKVVNVSRVSSSFLRPVMDNLFCDIHHFFVPLRLVYEDAEKVFGNPNPSAYNSDTLKEIPSVYLSGDTDAYTVSEKSVGDYLGLPLGTYDNDQKVSVLPFRAFAKIWNEWFRNENVQGETYINMTDTPTSSEKVNNNNWSASNYMGKLPSANKIKDIFTSCLPKPQKGLASEVPVSLKGKTPVFATGDIMSDETVEAYSGLAGMRMHSKSGLDVVNSTTVLNSVLGFPSDITSNMSKNFTLGGQDIVFPEDQTFTSLYPSNLWALWDNPVATANGNITVNDLRFAFQFQRMLEADALYGSRYSEYLLGHYGVSNPDSRLQFTEYLGGGRIPISVQQVAQTVPISEESNVGELGAFSLSNGFSRFSKSFTEHGYLFTVACIRQVHSYSQGLEKKWTRFDRNDFFDPLYAHLSEQPIYEEQLYHGSEAFKSKVFGYNEYGAEYRYIANRLTGEMRPQAANSQDIWHFGDNFASAPTLSDSFVKETPANVDRTLAVPSTSEDSFLCDFYFDLQKISVMPLYSTPGLVDHRG